MKLLEYFTLINILCINLIYSFKKSNRCSKSFTKDDDDDFFKSPKAYRCIIINI